MKLRQEMENTALLNSGNRKQWPMATRGGSYGNMRRKCCLCGGPKRNKTNKQAIKQLREWRVAMKHPPCHILSHLVTPLLLSWAEAPNKNVPSLLDSYSISHRNIGSHLQPKVLPTQCRWERGTQCVCGKEEAWETDNSALSQWAFRARKNSGVGKHFRPLRNST